MRKFIVGAVAVIVLTLLVLGVQIRYQYQNLKALNTTVFRLAAIDEALVSYAREHGRFPSCESAECLAERLPEIPSQRSRLEDGWGRPFVTQVGPTSYLIFSTGTDGERDAVWRGPVRFKGEPWRFEYDVVLENGQMPQYPWGILAGWWSPPWSVVVESQRSDASRGVLSICVAFTDYPAPTVKLAKDGQVVAEDQHPGRFTFFVAAGEYEVSVSAVGRNIPPQKILIEPNKVTSLDL
jgi:hypothetical protein